MDFRRVDLNLLVVLDTLFDVGTLTGVGIRLGLSQPTASASLAKLRILMGDELFVRSKGKMLPTARALLLREPVRRILRSVQLEVLAAAGFDPRTHDGVFTICLSDIGELEFLPGLVPRLAEATPHASIRAIICDPRSLSDAMDNGEVDLAIGYFPDLQAAVFNQQVLFNHGSSCIARKGHPNFQDELSLSQFENAGHIVVRQETRMHDVVDEAIIVNNVSRRIAMTISHFVNVPFLVSESDLIATIPTPLAMKFASIYPLNVFKPPFPILKLEIKQVWHRRFHSSPRLIWFRNLVAGMSQNKPSM